MEKTEYINYRIGMLVIIDKKKDKDHSYFLCKCDCGTKKWIRSDNLFGKRVTKSCGCLKKEKQFKIKDISGQRFGKLIALYPTDNRDQNNGSVIWECKCDCGNHKKVSVQLLRNKNVTSCGCSQKEYQKKHGSDIAIKYIKSNVIDNTNILMIKRTKLLKSNTSGWEGITYDKKRDKWIAQITFKKKHYFLGRFSDKNEAIKCRIKAKEKLHEEFMKEKEYKLV